MRQRVISAAVLVPVLALVLAIGGPVLAAAVAREEKDEARAEGFKRGLAGKAGTAGLTQGWTDDKAAGNQGSQQ